MSPKDDEQAPKFKIESGHHFELAPSTDNEPHLLPFVTLEAKPDKLLFDSTVLLANIGLAIVDHLYHIGNAGSPGSALPALAAQLKDYIAKYE